MKKKKALKSKDVYRLHIDAVPAHHSTPGVRHNSEVKPLHHALPRSRVWAFIWDKIQFIIVSVVVFAVIYVVLNWSALYMNAVHYWNVWRGFESPLERLVAEKPIESEKLPVPPAQPGSGINIPPLNIEVFPTDTRMVIPRINQNVPIIGVKNENLIAKKWNDLEADIQKALQSGVVHYPGTALPGDNGNIVLTGHSSYYVWDAGRFKDVFALLHDVRLRDKVVVYFDQKKYVYEVNDIKVVSSNDINILGKSTTEKLTLITCTPIGTNLKRLVVTAKLVEKG